MKTLGICCYAFLLVLFLNSCESKNTKQSKPQDTIKSGKIYISADESFKPVIDAEVKVFEGNNPGSEIIVQYKAEAEALKDFATDSIRMVIATRKHTPAEEDFMLDSSGVSPHSELAEQKLNHSM